MQDDEKADITPERSGELAQKRPEREPSRSTAAWKWLVRLGLVFVISIFGAQLVLKYYSDEIFGKLLQEFVERKSKGLYHVAYEELSFNLINQTLAIKGLALEADRLFYDSAKLEWNTQSDVFELFVPEVSIEGIDFRHIYASRSLVLERIYIKEPSISAYLHEGAIKDSTQTSLEQQQSNPFARLRFLLVKEVVLEKADFKATIIKPTQLKSIAFQDISGEAINFLLDSIGSQRNTRPFTVEDIHVITGHNSLELPNSPYILEFDRAEFSTYAAMFDIDALKITCQDSGKQDVLKGGKRSVFECEVPKVSGRGVDFRSLYFNKRLFMQQLRVVQPLIEIFRHRRTQGLPPNSIYPKMVKTLQSIAVSEVVVEEAALGMNWMPIQKEQKRYAIEGITGTLSSFLIDSLTHQERVKFFYINNAHVSIKKYSLPLPDHAHLVLAHNIEISTSKKTLEVRDLEVEQLISPKNRIRADSTKTFGSLALRMPLLKATNFDIKKAYAQKVFDMDYLLLHSPKASMYRYNADSLLFEKSDSLVRITDLYPYISSFAKRVRLGLLDMRDAQVDFKHRWADQSSELSIDSLGLRVEHWYIGPSTAKSQKHTLFNAEQLAMQWKGLHFMRPDSLYAIDIAYCKASQMDSVILLEGIKLSPQLSYFHQMPIDQRPAQAIGLQAASLLLDSIDLQKAYYEGRVDMQELHINKPIFNIQHLPSTRVEKLAGEALEERVQLFLARNFKSLNIKRIALDSGSLQSAELNGQRGAGLEQLSLYINDLEIDSSTLSKPTVLFTIDTLGMTASDFYWPMRDSLHALWANQITLSTQKKKIQIEGLVLDTVRAISDSTQRQYHIALPRFLAESIDLKKFYYEGLLDIGRIRLYQPDIAIDWPLEELAQSGGEVMHRPQFNDLYKSIEPFTKGIKLQQLYTRNLNISCNDPIKNILWHKSTWGVYIHDFQLDSFTTMLPSRFLYSDNISLHCRDFSHYLPDSSYHITADQLRFSTKTSMFHGMNLRVSPLKVTNEATALEAHFPYINYAGWDLAQWHRTGVISAKRLYFNKPWVKMSTAYTLPENRKSVSIGDVPSYLAPFTSSLQLQNTTIHQGSFGLLLRPKPDSTVYYEMKEIDCKATGFRADTSLVAKQKLLYSDVIDFKASNYRFNFPDSLHTFYADTIGFNTAKSHAYLINPHYNPIDTMGEYAIQLGQEADWIGLKANRIDLNGWNMRRWLGNKDFVARSLIVDSLRAKVYRDKRLPDVEGNYPALPRQALRELPFVFSMDSIDIRRSNFSYWEHALKGDHPGFIEANSLNALVKHVSNESTLINHWERATINLNMQLMHTGRLNAVFELPLDSDDGEYYYEGVLDSMDLTKLNPILEPTAFLKIRSGYAKRVRFKVLGNNDYATGIMRFYYQDLKVGVINPDKNNDDGLISFIANTFVVNKSNPHHLIFMRKGKMFFPRNKEKSLMHYWVNTLLSGIKTSIGLKNKDKPDKAIRKTVFDAIVERFKVEGLAERKLERERNKRIKEALKEQQKLDRKRKN